MQERLSHEQRRLWAALVGYGAEPLAADQLARELEPGPKSFGVAVERLNEAAEQSDLLQIIDYTGVAGDSIAIRSAVLAFAELSSGKRFALLSDLVFGSELDRIAVDAPTHFHDAIATLLDSEPMPNAPAPAAVTPTMLAVAAGVLLVVTLVALAVSAPESQDAVPLPAFTTTTTAPVVSEPDLGSLVIDRDRVVDLRLDDDGSVIRLDPQSQTVIWRSRVFADAVTLRVDADVVTVGRESGWRTYLSAIDGTQLPP